MLRWHVAKCFEGCLVAPVSFPELHVSVHYDPRSVVPVYFPWILGTRLTSLSPRPKTNPSTDRFQYHFQ